MINKIIDSLLPSLQALSFADLVAGVVVPVSRDIPNDGDTGTVTETFPAYLNYSKTVCAPADYIDLVPDSARKSIMYFEDGGSTIESESRHYYNVESSVKLVWWANLKNISALTLDGTILSANILEAIPHFLPNIDYCTKIQIEFTGMDKNDSGIFSAYTYEETRKQYLMYPFDYGALNFTIKWQLAKDCINDIVINSDPCLQ